MNQYKTRSEEIDHLIEGRMLVSEGKQDWIYNEEVQTTTKNKYKYQDVEMYYKIDFLDDMKNLIFDAKRNPDDFSLFANTDWKLTLFEEQDFALTDLIPPMAAIKKKNINTQKIDETFGEVELEGRVNVKYSQVNYTPMHFNLRNRAVYFYDPHKLEEQEKQVMCIPFNETSFNYQGQTDEYFSLKDGQKVLKIKKQSESRELIRLAMRKILICAFRGSYCLRDEVPSLLVEDYICKDIDKIQSIDFVHENHIKEITNSRYYRESIGGFFYLLKKQNFKRKTISAEITYPKWFKPLFKEIPQVQTNLITNIVPDKYPLMSLKIKLHDSEISALNQNLKYIFPFYKTYLKRTLIVYESNLHDESIKYMMNQVSYPMHSIGFPKNQLSLTGLEYVINASSTLYHEIVDFSFNTKLMSISGGKVFMLTNANPSIKKLTIKGCYVLLGEEEDFFQALTNNMCLKELEIDYMDSYSEHMIKYLGNYDAEIY